MPQLDKFTFSTQVVWLVLIFFFLYFILVQIGLPRLYRILYFRKKKLLSLNQGSVNFVSELFFFSNNLNSFLSGYVQRVKNFSEIFYRLPQQKLL